MTFDQLVSDICEQLNLTSEAAKSRVSRTLNTRYKRLTSSIGLELSRREQVSQAAVIGNRLITFNGIEKVLTVIDKTSGRDIILEQISIDEMHTAPIRSDPPRKFAVMVSDATSVTIQIDSTPATTFTLYVDGMVTLSTLSGNQVPAFPESFHDTLIFGTMADEYRKMEKAQLSQMCEQDYERRLSDLRMWIAKSSWQDLYQGKTKSTSCLDLWRNN